MNQSIVYQMINNENNNLSSRYGQSLNSSFEEKVIPEKKTISEYVSALDRAVETFFQWGDNDDIFAILKDAKNNNLVPREYNSQNIERFETYGMVIRKANISYKKNVGIKARLYVGFGSVIITPNFSKITKQVTINDKLGKIVNLVQETLQKMEKYIK